MQCFVEPSAVAVVVWAAAEALAAAAACAVAAAVACVAAAASFAEGIVGPFGRLVPVQGPHCMAPAASVDSEAPALAFDLRDDLGNDLAAASSD